MGNNPSSDEKIDLEDEPQAEEGEEKEEKEEAASRAASAKSGASNFSRRASQAARPDTANSVVAGSQPTEVVNISRTGFSVNSIDIAIGQAVMFSWNESQGNGYNVKQVVHDGDQLRVVPGGFGSGSLAKVGKYKQQFNSTGEFKFAVGGLRCAPLTINVFLKEDLEVGLTDDGFSPKILHIDQGTALAWVWENCQVPHWMYEMRYCPQHGGFTPMPLPPDTHPVKEGEFEKKFLFPGLFYFQTEGLEMGSRHSCFVHVRPIQKEHKIKISDKTFEPIMLVINQGERVWFKWDQESCHNDHCIYQVDPPPQDHDMNEAFKPTEKGFK